MLQKTKSLETSASQKNPRTVNTQEKHSGRKQTALENSEETETQLVQLGKKANEIFADVRVKRNYIVQHYHIVRFRAIHYKRFIFRNAKSHCSLIW